MTILRTDSVTVQHSKTSTILNFPDITIHPEDRILLLGPSGSGKTTFLSVIAGLLAPGSGKVFVKDKDLYALTAKERDHLRGATFGFVFQTLHLLPSLTIAQNILLVRDMSGVPSRPDRLESLLLSLGLNGLADRKPGALSQGQQQRAALARAIFNSPSIIIADEPTSSLDDQNTDIVMDLLDQQARESQSALLVATHDHRIKQRFQNIIDLTSLSLKGVA